MSRTIGVGRHCDAVPAAQRGKRPPGWSRAHPRAVRALGTTFLMAAVAGCAAEPAEESGVESAPTTAVDVPLLEEQPDGGQIAPGRYVLNPFDSDPSAPVAPVLEVPEGFSSIGGAGVVDWGAGYRLVGLWDIDAVFTHPCDVSGSPERVGPSVADLAGALAAQPMREATEPVPVTIGGYEGLYLELSTPDDISNCPGGYFRSWPGREDNAAGVKYLLWIVDVEGQRITFDLSYTPGATPEQVDELREIVTTATFIRREGT